MSEARGSRVPWVLATALAVASAAVIAGLAMAARREGGGEAWSARWVGFGAAGAALAVAVAVVAARRSGRTHYWGLVSALAFAALLAGAYSYRPAAPEGGRRTEAIPLVIGRWVGQPEPVRQEVKDILVTDDIISRVYVRGGELTRAQPAEPEWVAMSVVFAVGSRKVAHPPEQCLSAAGYEMEEIERESFATSDGRTFNGQRLIIVKGDDIKAVFYTYKVGNLYTGSFLRQQLQVMWLNLTLQSGTRVGLVQFTTRISSLKRKQAGVDVLKDFAREALPAIEKALQ